MSLLGADDAVGVVLEIARLARTAARAEVKHSPVPQTPDDHQVRATVLPHGGEPVVVTDLETLLRPAPGHETIGAFGQAVAWHMRPAGCRLDRGRSFWAWMSFGPKIDLIRLVLDLLTSAPNRRSARGCRTSPPRANTTVCVQASSGLTIAPDGMCKHVLRRLRNHPCESCDLSESRGHFLERASAACRVCDPSVHLPSVVCKRAGVASSAS